MVWLRTAHQQNRFRLELVLSKIGILPEMEQLWSEASKKWMLGHIAYIREKSDSQLFNYTQYKLVTYRKLMNCVKDTRNRNISTNKLPLCFSQRAVGLARWMSYVANHCKEGE
uniref:Uncharacterized protein n=2 Tax=Helianthus annuus TaxID=4232 RepID=A0A251T0F2_HELAN